MSETTTIKERKPRTKRRGGLYVNDTELLERLGIPDKLGRQTLHVLDHSRTSNFPKKQPLWGGRRYWPAVEAWLDRTGGLVTIRDRTGA